MVIDGDKRRNDYKKECGNGGKESDVEVEGD